MDTFNCARLDFSKMPNQKSKGNPFLKSHFNKVSYEHKSFHFQKFTIPKMLGFGCGQTDVEFMGKLFGRMQKFYEKLVEMQIFKAIVDVDFSYIHLQIMKI